MKISNEAKIGALTALGIIVLIFGFNFLKGKKVFEKRTHIYAIFPSIEGLEPSNPVTINGLKVGAVSALTETDKNISGIKVEITLSKDILIPVNSTATINPSLGGLGTTSLFITLGDSKEYMTDGAIMNILDKPGVMEEVRRNLTPTLERVNQVMDSLKQTLGTVNNTLDGPSQQAIQATISNLAASTHSLQILLHAQNGALAHSLKHVEHITANLAANGNRVNQVMENMETVSGQLANSQIDATMERLNSSIGELNHAISQLNTTDGSAGLLLNDKKLYNNLEQATLSLNTLLDDVRTHPKRYVSFSVFGKKDKGTPLQKPLHLQDSAIEKVEKNDL